jgi:hypothetical protein
MQVHDFRPLESVDPGGGAWVVKDRYRTWVPIEHCIEKVCCDDRGGAEVEEGLVRGAEVKPLVGEHFQKKVNMATGSQGLVMQLRDGQRVQSFKRTSKILFETSEKVRPQGYVNRRNLAPCHSIACVAREAGSNDYNRGATFGSNPPAERGLSIIGGKEPAKARLDRSLKIGTHCVGSLLVSTYL